MGYAKNKRAFHELAQILPLSILRSHAHGDRDALMALLFGVSGLLPSSRGLRDRESRRYVIQLRRRWKELRTALRCPVMHEADWLFFRLRPLNFPTARIAVLVSLLPVFLQPGVARRILACFREPGFTPQEQQDSLRQLFAFVADGYWSRHLHFRGTGSGPSIALGTGRIDAIIFTTLLPIALLHARVFDDRALRLGAIALARTMPAPPRNTATRSVEENVLRGSMSIDTALIHHGAIELYKRCCEKERCAECPILSTRFPCTE
jgi:hypothetical protein